MAEAFRDDLDVNASLEEQRRGGVAKIVELHPRQACPVQQQVVRPAKEVASVDRGTSLGREDEIFERAVNAAAEAA